MRSEASSTASQSASIRFRIFIGRQALDNGGDVERAPVPERRRDDHIGAEAPDEVAVDLHPSDREGLPVGHQRPAD